MCVCVCRSRYVLHRLPFSFVCFSFLYALLPLPALPSLPLISSRLLSPLFPSLPSLEVASHTFTWVPVRPSPVHLRAAELIASAPLLSVLPPSPPLPPPLRPIAVRRAPRCLSLLSDASFRSSFAPFPFPSTPFPSHVLRLRVGVPSPSLWLIKCSVLFVMFEGKRERREAASVPPPFSSNDLPTRGVGRALFTRCSSLHSPLSPSVRRPPPRLHQKVCARPAGAPSVATEALTGRATRSTSHVCFFFLPRVSSFPSPPFCFLRNAKERKEKVKSAASGEHLSLMIPTASPFYLLSVDEQVHTQSHAEYSHSQRVDTPLPIENVESVRLCRHHNVAVVVRKHV